MDNRHDRHTRRPRPINQKERVALHEGYFSEKLGFRLLEKPRSFH